MNEEFGGARLSCGSEKRPCASACQISSMRIRHRLAVAVEHPALTLMRSPETSGVTRLLLKASFQSYSPSGVSPYLKNGPTVCDGVIPCIFRHYLVSIGVALRPRSTMSKR